MSLPFALTGSQSRAIEEIAADLARPNQMNRMLMGDVGSGKTVVAFWAMIRAIECGHQAAMMAPTELLAEQHWRGFERICGRLGVRHALLTGNVTGSARSQILRGLASGEIQAVFGTHALIQERVRMRGLALGSYRRTASIRCFRSREAESIGAEGECDDDDGDADSTKPRDEPVCESRRFVSRRTARGTNADRD